MSRATYHVALSRDGGWKVQRQGGSRAESVHENKADAVARAQKLASAKNSGHLVIHRRDGTIQAEQRRKPLKKAKASRLKQKALHLTEDEADARFYQKHKNERRYSMAEVMRQAGYAVER